MICINEITKSYGNKRIIDKSTVCFDNNKINLLYGENGVGKTTLINLIAGVKKCDSGSIYFNDKKIDFLNGLYKKNIGFILTFPTYPYHYKVMEYINLLEKIYAIKKDPFYINFLNDLISFFELDDFLDEKINTLSTGYIKRVKIFASMIHNPSFYIWDEPFSGIDQEFLIKIIKKIKQLSSKGKGFLISSHINTTNMFKTSDVKIYTIKEKKILLRPS